MNGLRRLLHVVSGWFIGVAVTLAWVWIGEGKAEPQSGGPYIGLAILASVMSGALLVATLFRLTAYMIDGENNERS